MLHLQRHDNAQRDGVTLPSDNRWAARVRAGSRKSWFLFGTRGQVKHCPNLRKRCRAFSRPVRTTEPSIWRRPDLHTVGHAPVHEAAGRYSGYPG